MHAAALAYFREVVRTGSVRKAATRLNVAASALNRQILKLEAELGAPLFDRLPSGMRVTTAGELLMRHVTATLHDFDAVRAQIDDLKAARSGHVTIAALDSLLVDFLPRAIDRFRRDFPAVTYRVIAVQAVEIASMVASGDIDLGFAFVTPAPPSARFIAEAAAPLGVIMPADHPLARSSEISFDELRAYPILATESPLPRVEDSDPALAAFRAAVKPRIVSNSIQMLTVAIRLHMGLAIFTRIGFLKEIEAGELVWRPLRSPSLNRLRVGLVVPVTRALSAPAHQFARRLAHDLAGFLSPH